LRISRRIRESLERVIFPDFPGGSPDRSHSSHTPVVK
jgi:hypothetical protein